MSLTAEEHALLNTDIETVIHGYKVTLEFINDGGDIVSQCGIDKLGTPYGGSMGMLLGFGTLEDYDTGEEIIVPDRIAKAIVSWAESNGY